MTPAERAAKEAGYTGLYVGAFLAGVAWQQHEASHELEQAADTFRDFSNVLRAIGKDVMSAAADVAERHIREYLASIP